MISLAIVLPVEPVMPTTRTAWRDSPPGGQVLQRARARPARCTSGTRRISPGSVDRPLDQRGGGTAGSGVGHEGVAVGPLAAKRDEEADPG